MADRLWDRFLTDRDRKVFAASGYGARGGFGQRPALLVIDVSYGFTGDRPEPILESIERWSNSCGAEAWEALPHIRRLRDTCHERGIPVAYTTGAFRPDGWDFCGWHWKNGRAEESSPSKSRNLDPNLIHADVKPGAKDLVITKQMPSGFHGTHLLGYLVYLKVDSVIVVGTTTSGCVRATVVDAFSHGFRVIVPEEGCFDRSQASHALSLCDMNAKYADVLPAEDVLHYLQTVPPRLFDLPSGVAEG